MLWMLQAAQDKLRRLLHLFGSSLQSVAPERVFSPHVGGQVKVVAIPIEAAVLDSVSRLAIAFHPICIAVSPSWLICNHTARVHVHAIARSVQDADLGPTNDAVHRSCVGRSSSHIWPIGRGKQCQAPSCQSEHRVRGFSPADDQVVLFLNEMSVSSHKAHINKT